VAGLSSSACFSCACDACHLGVALLPRWPAPVYPGAWLLPRRRDNAFLIELGGWLCPQCAASEDTLPAFLVAATASFPEHFRSGSAGWFCSPAFWPAFQRLLVELSGERARLGLPSVRL
jgi:hypothetical protein